MKIKISILTLLVTGATQLNALHRSAPKEQATKGQKRKQSESSGPAKKKARIAETQASHKICRGSEGTPSPGTVQESNVQLTDEFLFADTGFLPNIQAIIKQFAIEPARFVPAITKKRMVTLGAAKKDFALLPDGKIAVTDKDNNLQIFDPITGHYKKPIKVHAEEISSLNVITGAIITTAYDKRMRLWDIKTKKRILSHDFSPRTISALQPLAENTVAIGFTDGTIKFYDYTTCAHKFTIKGNGTIINRIMVSADTQYCLALHGDDTLLIYALKEGNLLQKLSGIRQYAITKNNKLVLAGDDNHIYIQDIATGKQLAALKHGPLGTSITALEIMPDGNILSGDSKGDIMIWDAETGARLQTLKHVCLRIVTSMTSVNNNNIHVVTYNRNGPFDAFYSLHIYEVQQKALLDLAKLAFNDIELLKNVLIECEKMPAESRDRTCSPTHIQKAMLADFLALPQSIQECLASHYNLLIPEQS